MVFGFRGPGRAAGPLVPVFPILALLPFLALIQFNHNDNCHIYHNANKMIGIGMGLGWDLGRIGMGFRLGPQTLWFKPKKLTN